MRRFLARRVVARCGLGGLLVSVVTACGASSSAAPSPSIAASSSSTPRTGVADRPPIEPIAALAPDAEAKVSWLAPGKVQLELGGSLIDGPGPAKPLRVRIIDEHGAQVRLALDLGYARFSVWSERKRLFALLARETRIAPEHVMTGKVHVTLKPGARVTRLAHDDKAKRTQVRYTGAIEAEGWVADDALVDMTEPRALIGRIPAGGQSLMVIPGAVIRLEPKWAATKIAVMANGYFLDALNALGEAWHDVAYADGEIALRGFVSKQLPPEKTHRKRIDPETAPLAIAPNARAASGTCLYVNAGGDAIGYLVGEQEVDLHDAGRGWWNLAIDTPWGALTFAARGPSKTELASCGPPSAP